jgi:hypothetical protein
MDAGDVLAASDFTSDDQPFVQDWVVTHGVPGATDKTAAAAAAANVVMAREEGGAGDGLKGSDTGDQKWYFTSPASLFAFDTTAAYNGVLQASVPYFTPLTPSNLIPSNLAPSNLGPSNPLHSQASRY